MKSAKVVRRKKVIVRLRRKALIYRMLHNEHRNYRGKERTEREVIFEQGFTLGAAHGLDIAVKELKETK